MKIKKILFLFIFDIIFCSGICNGQLTGFFKFGLNLGTINQDWWHYESEDSIKYGKILLRPVVSIGGQLTSSKKWIFRQELMFQIKGQGTSVPSVRSYFRYSSPDVIRFISMPFTIHRKLFNSLFIGAGIQPSLFISGTDNYYAKEPWHGWVWGGNLNAQYIIDEAIELGIEYDHDFRLYYCPDCKIRFYTYRLYGAYHFH